jgi:hypothetical protein
MERSWAAKKAVHWASWTVDRLAAYWALRWAAPWGARWVVWKDALKVAVRAVQSGMR